jgi:DDE superfamily endonuclease
MFSAPWSQGGSPFHVPDPNRSAFEFAQVARKLAMQYPKVRTIHIWFWITSTSNCRKSLTDAFGDEIGRQVWDRFKTHFTPTHGSWLNQAEIEIGLFSRQCLGNRRRTYKRFVVRAALGTAA